MQPAASDHLTAYTIAQIIRSTARPNETVAETADRSIAILRMYEGHAPRDAIEDMAVTQIISMRFVVADAMEDLSHASEIGDGQRQARQAVTALNRVLLSWVKQFDQRRAREAKQQAQAEKSAPPVRTGTEAVGSNGASPAPPAVEQAAESTAEPAREPARDQQRHGPAGQAHAAGHAG